MFGEGLRGCEGTGAVRRALLASSVPIAQVPESSLVALGQASPPAAGVLLASRLHNHECVAPSGKHGIARRGDTIVTFAALR
jgi:hypothetical protein